MTGPGLPLQRDPSRDRISSAEFAVLTQRAAMRNASGGFEGEVNSSEDRQSRFANNIFRVASPSPQITAQSASYLPESNSASPSFAFQSAPTRDQRVSRPRHFNRGFGNGLGFGGLDANMPSQIPRNPQDTAATSRQHQARVRYMQRTLASDPNVILPRAPGPSTQLVAVGPPLTGRDTMTTTTLPSVLNPISRQPMMTYKQGLQAIFAETGSLLFRLTQLEPRPVSVVLKDPFGSPITVSEGLILTKETDIKAVVTLIQELLDEACAKEPTHDGSRLLVKVVEIRVGVTDGTQGYPPLQGARVGGERGKWAKWIKWTTRSDMETYWEAFRIMLQTQGAPKKGSTVAVAKPIFKVTTVRQENNEGQFSGGHEFYNVSDNVPLPAVVQPYGRGRDGGEAGFDSVDGGADTSSEISGGSAALISDTASQTVLSEGLYRLQLFDGASSNRDSRDGGSSNNSGQAPAPETSAPKEKTKSVDPTKTWEYYQRLGGDPKNWGLVDFSRVPFKVDPDKLPPLIPDPFLTPGNLDRVRNVWHDNGTEGSPTQKASDGLVPYHYIEAAWRALAAENHEKAISFEDDDVFFPNADIVLPTQNELLNARLAGHSKQKPKSTSNNTDAGTFFNGYCAPDNSQSHLSGIPGYDIAARGGNGSAQQTGLNSPFGGYAVPGGNGNLFGFAGFEIPSYDDARDKEKHADGQYTYPSPAYANKSPVATLATTSASRGSPLTRASSMNVHAAPFPGINPAQLDQGTNISMPSPYLQSHSGNHPAPYTRSGPYMTSQTRSTTPILHLPPPSMAGNQGVSIKENNSSFALHVPEFKPSFGNQASYPQQGSSTALMRSPEPMYGRNSSPEKSIFANVGATALPPFGCPDTVMPFNTTGHPERRASPNKPSGKKKKHHSQRSGSPDKLTAAEAATRRIHSPDKSATQYGFGDGAQYVQNIGTGSSMLQYPSLDSNTQQGHNSSFGQQYTQNAHSFDSNFQGSSQDAVNNGGQGTMQAGVQGHTGGSHVADQIGGQSQGGGQAGHARGRSWIYRGGKMPKQEFSF